MASYQGYGHHSVHPSGWKHYECWFEKALALQTSLNLPASEIISTYVYQQGLLNGNYSFSTAVGLFNTVINVILLVLVNMIVKKMNEGKGL